MHFNQARHALKENNLVSVPMSIEDARSTIDELAMVWIAEIAETNIDSNLTYLAVTTLSTRPLNLHQVTHSKRRGALFLGFPWSPVSGVCSASLNYV